MIKKIVAYTCFVFAFILVSYSLNSQNYELTEFQDVSVTSLDLTTEELEPEFVVVINVYDPDIDRVPNNASEYDVDDLLIYIKEQCRQLNINYNYALSLLREENPTFFRIIEGTNSWDWMPYVFNAINSSNSNGTCDYGLWQLNGQYLWADYIPRFWHHKTEFDWSNPYHSTYIALRHIRWIYDTLNRHYNYGQFINSLYWETALVYNAGLGRVLSKTVPEKTLDYATNVMSRVY